MVTSPRPLNVKLLSDSQLLDVFRSNPQNPELREEVFQRCLFKIRWVVQAYVFERGICPPEHDRYAFCDAVIDRAFEWLTRKIDEAPDKFDSWLGSLARYALISEYRSESGGVINPKLIESLGRICIQALGRSDPGLRENRICRPDQGGTRDPRRRKSQRPRERFPSSRAY